MVVEAMLELTTQEIFELSQTLEPRADANLAYI